MGQQVVGQEDRLGPLEVGVAGQVGVAGFSRPGQQHLLQGDDGLGHLAQRPLGEQAEVGGHLVVPAAPGVEPGADLGRQLGYPALDGGMDVLVAGLEDEAALGQFLLHLAQSG